MSIFDFFTSNEKHQYRKQLAERTESVNNQLESATRKLLHVAGRATSDGKQDIFSEFQQGLERRRNARIIPN